MSKTPQVTEPEDPRIDEEIIACELLGWSLQKRGAAFAQRYRDYYHTASETQGLRCWARVDVIMSVEINCPALWPNFTDERAKHYWVDRMQRAIVAKGLAQQYFLAMSDDAILSAKAEYNAGGNPKPPSEAFDIVVGFFTGALATPKQRVAAAIQALKMAAKEKAKV